MLLPSPSSIQSIKKDEEEKTRLRVSALAREESEIVFKLNIARQEDAVEREKMSKEFDAFKENIAEVRKALLDEVQGLEGRKAEAMKPVEGILAEARATLARANAKLKEAEKAMEAVAPKEIALTVREKAVEVKEAEVVELRESLRPKEAEILSRENAVVESEKALSINWDQYHKAVSDHDKEVAIRETRNKTDAIANENERKVLEERRAVQDRKDREIVDRYATLERTINRLKP